MGMASGVGEIRRECEEALEIRKSLICPDHSVEWGEVGRRPLGFRGLTLQPHLPCLPGKVLRLLRACPLVRPLVSHFPGALAGLSRRAVSQILFLCTWDRGQPGTESSLGRRMAGRGSVGAGLPGRGRQEQLWGTGHS